MFANYLKQFKNLPEVDHIQKVEESVQAIVSTVPHDQKEFKTCFAFVIATMIRACERRIYGRISKAHYTIVNDIIAEHGT